jgi:acyl-coenzyme A thioesterase PaaI-like protein
VPVGQRSKVWQIEIHDERSRLVCISRITLATVERPDRPPGSAGKQDK